MSLAKILKIIAEILLIIAENLPLSYAISEVASKHNISKREVRNIWNQYGK